ncbi:hypothetical protein [Nakamurella deserti]|uniref:hypothetical protein n=1 Tax=Nakamurella deserti TaxID=2164074 RepID=UPI001300A7EB|nr:hypothetical protein [Nakamurella deserti]
MPEQVGLLLQAGGEVNGVAGHYDAGPAEWAAEGTGQHCRRVAAHLRGPGVAVVGAVGPELRKEPTGVGAEDGPLMCAAPDGAVLGELRALLTQEPSPSPV